MSAMIGKWICCPEMTIGFEEFNVAIETPEENWKKRAGVAYTCAISRDWETWHVTVNYPDNVAISRSYEFKSGVEIEFPAHWPGGSTKGLVVVGDNIMTRTMRQLVDGEVIREWEAVLSTEGDYLVNKCKYQGKEMVEKFKKM